MKKLIMSMALMCLVVMSCSKDKTTEPVTTPPPTTGGVMNDPNTFQIWITGGRAFTNGWFGLSTSGYLVDPINLIDSNYTQTTTGNPINRIITYHLEYNQHISFSHSFTQYNSGYYDELHVRLYKLYPTKILLYEAYTDSTYGDPTRNYTYTFINKN